MKGASSFKGPPTGLNEACKSFIIIFLWIWFCWPGLSFFFHEQSHFWYLRSVFLNIFWEPGMMKHGEEMTLNGDRCDRLKWNAGNGSEISTIWNLGWESRIRIEGPQHLPRVPGSLLGGKSWRTLLESPKLGSQMNGNYPIWQYSI